MGDRLSLKINPFELCDRRETLEGEILLKELKRVLPLIKNQRGYVIFYLKFGREKGFPFINGFIQTHLTFECQRCGKAVSYDINVKPCMSPVKDDYEAKQLPRAYDPLLITSEKVTLVELVEEELLLSLPMIPRHEQC